MGILVHWFVHWDCLLCKATATRARHNAWLARDKISVQFVIQIKLYCLDYVSKAVQTVMSQIIRVSVRFQTQIVIQAAMDQLEKPIPKTL